MATESEAESSAESHSSSSDSESEAALVVESLVAGREKRATAGNRLSSLLDREAADDELELLFAEDGEDVEFEGASEDAQSDIQFDSSDEAEDDERKAPAEDGLEELEGERELQRQARVDRQAKKRKTADAYFMPPALRNKKLKTDPISKERQPTTSTAPRPKKKSERVSWIPETADAPTRSSSRRATVQNKNLVHERLQESEKRRVNQIAVMEAAAKRKQKSEPKVMTQADRLAEADRTEKANSKSLNRWEEAEKKRSEEQAAKLAALQNRVLDGPVITWWSGMAEWVGGKLMHVGRKARPIVGEHDQNDSERMSSDTNPIDAVHAVPIKSTIQGPPDTDATRRAGSSSAPTEPPSDLTTPPLPASTPLSPQPPPSAIVPDPPGATDAHAFPERGFLSGIEYYASLPDNNPPRAPCTSPPPLDNPSADPLPSEPVPPSSQPTSQLNTSTSTSTSTTLVAPPKPEPEPEHSTRNLVILSNFDPIAIRDRETQRRILFKQRTSRPHKHPQQHCAITSHPARFRDPKTGLPYLNPYAYKEIQRLRGGAYEWSGLLGVWVGPVGAAARGVPDGFSSL